MIADSKSESSISNEYVQKFTYRQYTGHVESRLRRIWSLTWFELVSVWHKSTVGKVLLIIILALNLLVITFGALALNVQINNLPESRQKEAITTVLHAMVANYLSSGITSDVSQIYPSDSNLISFRFPLGFLIIGLFAIAGSGLFADDRQGRIMELYMSKVQRWEYAAGKVGAIILYINIFATVPLLIMSFLYIQALGADHLDYLYPFYFGVILYGFLASLLLGLVILVLSITVEKRMYASLGFYLFFIIGSIFGAIVTEIDPSNEMLLLVSPSTFLELLGYVCLQDYSLFFQGEWIGWDEVIQEDIFAYTPLTLDNGTGLEYLHIFGVYFALVIGLFLFLVFKLHRLTTEALA
ncbi:MAG: hypothetical protein ACXAB4_05325 [Candidatus Hodarchaeales archaeon]|jgi:ABC-type transport system involved in multi-copper enzyme maturation permease subunit